jgi:hypothetical protein
MLRKEMKSRDDGESENPRHDRHRREYELKLAPEE